MAETKEIKKTIEPIAEIPKAQEVQSDNKARATMLLESLIDQVALLKTKIEEKISLHSYTPFTIRTRDEQEYHTTVAQKLVDIKAENGKVARIEEDKIDGYYVCNIFTDLG
jgi:hypothetical protein